MSPHTDFIRTTSARADIPKWDPAQGLFTPVERRTRGIDRTALCVQITLCIVVAALLFSVIALPKFRTSASNAQALGAPQAASRGR